MVDTKAKQARAEAALGGQAGMGTGQPAMTNAERHRKVASFTLGPEAIGDLEQLAQIYEGLNASELVEKAIRAYRAAAGGAPMQDAAPV